MAYRSIVHRRSRKHASFAWHSDRAKCKRYSKSIEHILNSHYSAAYVLPIKNGKIQFKDPLNAFFPHSPPPHAHTPARFQYNHTDNGHFEVFRGKRRVHDIGRIHKVDGKSQMDVWNGKACNEIKGTDGLMYPPFMKKSDRIWIFQRVVCRSFGMKFEKSRELTGIPVHKFSFDFEDIPGNKSLSCYCRKDGKCPKRGTMDLFPCLGAPITLSQPHFYNADPSLLAAIGTGLYPNAKEHEIYVNFELVRRTGNGGNGWGGWLNGYWITCERTEVENVNTNSMRTRHVN